MTRALDALGHAMGVAGSMAWQVTWSLILGFALSGVVQAVIRRQTLTRLLGDDKPKPLAVATGLGRHLTQVCRCRNPTNHAQKG